MAASVDYAQEVYAACATIGFTDSAAATLKALLDKIASGQDVDEAALLEATKAAQIASIYRAGV